VALSPEVLEGVRGSDAAKPRTGEIARAARHALEKSAPERVTDAGGIDDPVRRHGGDVTLDGASVKGALFRVTLPTSAARVGAV